MMNKVEALKVGADTATGFLIADNAPVTGDIGQDGLIMSLVTIIARIILEAIINRRIKRKKTE